MSERDDPGTKQQLIWTATQIFVHLRPPNGERARFHRMVHIYQPHRPPPKHFRTPSLHVSGSCLLFVRPSFLQHELVLSSFAAKKATSSLLFLLGKTSPTTKNKAKRAQTSPPPSLRPRNATVAPIKLTKLPYTLALCRRRNVFSGSSSPTDQSGEIPDPPLAR